MVDAEPKRPAGQRDPGGVGKAAEEAVKKYLTQTGQLAEDVRSERFYQWWDVDFVLKSGLTVEVKGDTYLHKSGNLFFEYARNGGHTPPGCFTRSKAEWWYYVDTETGDCFVFSLAHALAWCMEHMGEDVCQRKTSRAHRNGKFETFRGLLVNLEAFRADVKVEVLRLGVG